MFNEDSPSRLQRRAPTFNLQVGVRLTMKQSTEAVRLTFASDVELLNDELDKPLKMCPQVAEQFIKISLGSKILLF